MSGNKFETTATECSKWEEWLHDAVDEANDVSDKLDWSTEQVLAYAILQARSSAYEECAKIAEKERRTDLALQHGYKPSWYVVAQEIAAAIRSKANQ